MELTPILLILFTTEEITSYTNETATVSKKALRNPPSCFFISCFHVIVTPSINTPESSNVFIVLIMSFISSLKINKVNPLPALTAPFSHVFLSTLLQLKLNNLLIQVNCL